MLAIPGAKQGCDSTNTIDKLHRTTPRTFFKSCEICYINSYDLVHMVSTKKSCYVFVFFFFLLIHTPNFFINVS